jgi:GxxExxY protein
MLINEVSGIIVDEALRLHDELGPGLLESVYEVLLCHRLQRRRLRVARQVTIPVRIDGIVFDEGFRADLIVDDLVIVELKSTDQFHPVHAKQLLTYLRLTDKRLGLLINFGLPLLKHGIKRIVHNLPPSDSLPTASAPSAPPRETNIP